MYSICVTIWFFLKIEFMNRLDFLRIIGFSAATPSVLILPENEGTVGREVAIENFNSKRWPIYPEITSFMYKEGGYVCTSIFTYVKINRGGKDYLIPVRENGVGDIKTKDRFEWRVTQTQEKFIVDESNEMWFERGFVIKYNPKIHNC